MLVQQVVTEHIHTFVIMLISVQSSVENLIVE